MVSMAAVYDCGFELVDHPPYPPDLAPSDYFMFSNMTKLCVCVCVCVCVCAIEGGRG